MTIALLAIFGLHFGSPTQVELRDLHTQAIRAYQSHDYHNAKKAYEEILDKVLPPQTAGSGIKCDWQTYVDVALRYAEVELILEEFEEGEKVLVSLLDSHPPENFHPQITILLAKLLAARGQTEAAFIRLKDLEKVSSLQNWRGEDKMFFHSLEYLLNDKNDHLLKQAKAYCLAGEYLEGAKIYEKVLGAIEMGVYPKSENEKKDSILSKKIRYRLAESYFHAAHFDKTIALAKDSSPQPKADAPMLYLAAIAYKAKNEYEKAIDCFQSYVDAAPALAAKGQQLVLINEALYEIGLSLYQNKQWIKAKGYFEKICQNESNKKVYYLASIYLSRIHLKIDNPLKAEEILQTIATKIDKLNPLLLEISYLRGECAFALQNYENALWFFDHCLSHKKTRREWDETIVFKLGLCHMQMASILSLDDNKRRYHFDTARTHLEKLASSDQPNRSIENVYLAIAHLCLLEEKFIPNPSFKNQIECLLEAKIDSFSKEGQIEALLATGLLQPTAEKRAYFFEQACLDTYADTTLYAEAFAQRALNDFSLAQSSSDKEKKEALFAASITGFEKAFSLFEKTNSNRAAEVLKLEAKANLYNNSPSLALAAIDKLLKEFPMGPNKSQEALYLKGLIYLHLKQEDLAEGAFTQVASLFPQGKYSDAGLYTLATLYFQKGDYINAERHYDELSTNYPDSKYAGEALYWSAEALEHSHQEPTKMIARRKECYDKYPNSTHAPHAYFKCFTSDDYLEGKQEALCFLKNFPNRFPNSPLLVACFYFLAIHENDFLTAKAQFEKAISTFNSYYEAGGVDLTSLIYFRYRSMLALASRYMERQAPQELLQAAYLIHSITQEFEDEKHPLSSACNHPELYEESQFTLGQCYIKLGKVEKGKEIFFKMLAQYDKAGIKHAYYLSRIWQAQAGLAIESKDTDTAIKCLEMAYDCGEGHLSCDERLAIWLQISEVWRGVKKFDLSMRMLSKVINEDAISPLRLKAMYLRAEIYELEGRPELAIRQLEACAKNEGLWASKAQEKLKKHYGIE